MIRLDLATDAYIGARSQQQDAAGAYGFGLDGGVVLVLGDGLGGHAGGAEASHIVRETFREAASTGVFDEQIARHAALLEALERANQRIANGVDPAHGQRGMASTAVAVVVAEDNADWISVGDSHFYIWRDGRLAKINEDHSQAGVMLRSGNFKPTDPEVMAAKSILVSALTGRRLELIDHPAEPFKLLPGDLILLASDGLNTISDSEIEKLLTDARNASASEITTMLLDAVRQRRADRQDNTAVVVARVVDLAEQVEVSQTEVVIPTQITAPTDANIGVVTEHTDADRPGVDKTITDNRSAAGAAAAGATSRESVPPGWALHKEGGAPFVRTAPPQNDLSQSTRPTYPTAIATSSSTEPRRPRSALPWISAVILLLSLVAVIQYLGLWALFLPSSSNGPSPATTKGQPASQSTATPPIQQPATNPTPQQAAPAQPIPTTNPGAPVILPPTPAQPSPARSTQTPGAPSTNTGPANPEPTITPGAGHADAPAPRIVPPPAAAPQSQAPQILQPAPPQR